MFAPHTPSRSRDLYCQCLLERLTPRGLERTTSWIPAKFAIVGRMIRLRDEDGNWEAGWTVRSASVPYPEPSSPHQQIRNHRRATGDASR